MNRVKQIIEVTTILSVIFRTSIILSSVKKIAKIMKK